jgi:hypothetical protein
VSATEWPARWHKDRDAEYPVLLCGVCPAVVGILYPPAVGLGRPRVLAPIGLIEREPGLWDVSARDRRRRERGGGHQRPKPRRKVNIGNGKRGYMHQQMNSAIAQRGMAIVTCMDCGARNRIDDDVLAPGTTAVLGSTEST